MEQTITDLDDTMLTFLANQNEWVRGHLMPEAESEYETARGKMRLLQGILDAEMYAKTDTAELQGLGICFGEILRTELGLHWVIVEDEYGRDPALRYKSTSVIFFPRTMISKRIERGEAVDIEWLLEESVRSLNSILTEQES